MKAGIALTFDDAVAGYFIQSVKQLTSYLRSRFTDKITAALKGNATENDNALSAVCSSSI
jgi:hypothetical protein